MIKLLLIPLFILSVMAQRTPLAINGTVLNNPNFKDGPSVVFDVVSSNVTATAGGDTIYVTNLFAEFSYISNIYNTNIFSEFNYTSNLYVTNLFVTENSYLSNLYVTNFIITSNLYSTNIYSSNFYTTNLFVTQNSFLSNVYVTNVLLTQNSYTSNLFVTNFLVTSNLYVTNLYVENIFGATNNWVNQGSSNSTLSGIAYPWKVVATNSVEVGTAGTAGSVTLYDTDASNSSRLTPNGTTTTDINFILPAAPFAGLAKWTVSATTNFTMSQATAGTDYFAPGSLTQTKSLKLQFPRLVDGSGCVYVNTNDYTAFTFMVPRFSGTAATNVNYCQFAFRVPTDLNTAVDLTASLTVRLTAGDTAASAYTVGMVSIANSAPAAGTPANYTTLTVGADGSGASGDIESVSAVTLTGWRSNMTAGQWCLVQLQRNGADASTVAHDLMELEIFYSSTQ